MGDAVPGDCPLTVGSLASVSWLLADANDTSGSVWTTVAWVASIALYLASFAAALWVLRRRGQPTAMFAWIVILIFLPILGLLVWLLLGEPRFQRKKRRRKERREHIERALARLQTVDTTEQAAGHPEEEEAATPGLPAGLLRLAELSQKFTSHPLRTASRLRIFEETASIYDDILESIRGAQHHVHLEYYIFRSDEAGRLFLDALTEKAREGVEVRVLIDSIGSFSTMSWFWKPLREAGGQVAYFLPAIPFGRRWNINYRNHRKIVVVDGRVAYMGSQNIGNEYRGLWRRVVPWKDTHLRLEGNVVIDLQQIFVADWYFTTREDLTESTSYFPQIADAAECHAEPGKGACTIQVIPSGLDSPHDLLGEFIYTAFGLAERSIRITTPYFVPDPGLLVALKAASYRGVRVELLIPQKTDSRVVLLAGRSYYAELLQAGVRIVEHPSAMLHSKIVLIDDAWALVGSVNMDIRSFSLNFEVSASIFDSRAGEQLHRAFTLDCGAGLEIQQWPPAERRLFAPYLEGVARMLSPIL